MRSYPNRYRPAYGDEMTEIPDLPECPECGATACGCAAERFEEPTQEQVEAALARRRSREEVRDGR